MVDTTESGKSLNIESAAELLVQPEEQPEAPVEDIEEEAEQPQEDLADDTEDSEDAEVADADTEDAVEGEDVEGEDEYEDTEDADEAAGPDEKFHTVKVDGQEVQVTEAELKRSYSGQKYVQQGMQQAAEQRKEAENVYVSLMQERENLANLVQQLELGAVARPQEPSRVTYEGDPIGLMEAKLDYEDNMKIYNETQAKVQQHLQQQTAAEQNARAALAQQEAQKLIELVPELRDADKASKFKEQVVKTAVDHYGYSAEQIASITSYRDLLVLRDAMKYHHIIANRDAVKEKAKKARPVIKPGSKKVSTGNDVTRRHQAALKKTGSLDAALALMVKE